MLQDTQVIAVMLNHCRLLVKKNDTVRYFFRSKKELVDVV
jgi:hypothetical protein